MSASELFCFVRFFGQIIGDLVPTTSDIWQLYVILKKIIDIITSRCIQNDCHLLLIKFLMNIMSCF